MVDCHNYVLFFYMRVGHLRASTKTHTPVDMPRQPLSHLSSPKEFMSPNQMYLATYCLKQSLFGAEVIQLKIYLPINTSLLFLTVWRLRAEKVSK